MSVKITAPSNLGAKFVQQVSRAMTSAARDTAAEIKDRGRSEIAKTTTTRMANAWRVNVNPKNKESMNPRLFAYHKATYANIFETGGQVRPSSSRFLWIPFPDTQKLLGTNSRRFTSGGSTTWLTSRMRSRGAELVYIPPKNGRPPLLAAKYTTTKKNKFGSFRPKSQKGKSALANEPLKALFFGRKVVTEPDLWSVKSMAKAEWRKLSTRVRV